MLINYAIQLFGSKDINSFIAGITAIIGRVVRYQTRFRHWRFLFDLNLKKGSLNFLKG